MSITNLVIMNFHPIEEASNKSIGILVVDHAPIKIKTFENLLPLCRSTPAIGKAAYNGPYISTLDYYQRSKVIATLDLCGGINYECYS